MIFKSRTMIATPTYRRQIDPVYAASLVRDSVVAALSGHLIESPFFIEGTMLEEARNQCVERFLKSDLDYLVFIDDDTGWEPGALLDLIELPQQMDIVAGVCTTKTDPPIFPYTSLPDRGASFAVDQIREAGACFMRITRPALARMNMQGGWFNRGFFDEALKSEDLSFCRRAHEAGVKVYGKFDIEFVHAGQAAWCARASDHLNLQPGIAPGLIEKEPACPA